MSGAWIFAAGFLSGLVFCFVWSSIYRKLPDGIVFLVMSRLARKHGKKIEINTLSPPQVFYFWRGVHYR